MKPLIFISLSLAATSAAWGEFRFRDIDSKSVELSENGAPVFVYNHGMMLKEGTAPDRTRCCYLHPVYAPNGAVITDDFPKDHPHHRGISWMWPDVSVEGKVYDLWTIKGMLAHFEKFERKEAGKDSAVSPSPSARSATGNRAVTGVSLPHSRAVPRCCSRPLRGVPR